MLRSEQRNRRHTKTNHALAIKHEDLPGYQGDRTAGFKGTDIRHPINPNTNRHHSTRASRGLMIASRHRKSKGWSRYPGHPSRAPTSGVGPVRGFLEIGWEDGLGSPEERASRPRLSPTPYNRSIYTNREEFKHRTGVVAGGGNREAPSEVIGQAGGAHGLGHTTSLDQGLFASVAVLTTGRVGTPAWGMVAVAGWPPPMMTAGWAGTAGPLAGVPEVVASCCGASAPAVDGVAPGRRLTILGSLGCGRTNTYRVPPLLSKEQRLREVLRGSGLVSKLLPTFWI